MSVFPTRRQVDVLWVVDEHGPITAGEVALHLRLDTSQARSTLSTLEYRALVDATYTNARAGHRGRGYVSTLRGREFLAETEAGASNGA